MSCGILLCAGAFASVVLAQSPGTFIPTGSMITARAGHMATLLLDGRVLLAGGGTSSAELYEPSTGSFTPTGSMTLPRRLHTATLLLDGRVLIVGGFVAVGNSPTASAELYDPSSGFFTAIGDVGPVTNQAWHTARSMSEYRLELSLEQLFRCALITSTGRAMKLPLSCINTLRITKLPERPRAPHKVNSWEASVMER